MNFFFSSRRRHTRCLSDCSSDVCSSDLAYPARTSASVDRHGDGRRELAPRSEERRVGKECSSGWWQYQYKKKVHDTHEGKLIAKAFEFFVKGYCMLEVRHHMDFMGYSYI